MDDRELDYKLSNIIEGINTIIAEIKKKELKTRNEKQKTEEQEEDEIEEEQEETQTEETQEETTENNEQPKRKPLFKARIK